MESYCPNSFELLSPAGSPEIMKAVIAAGADAIYVGGSRFGARAYAQNFSDEELCEAIDYVHLHGRKLYLAVNTLVKNSEMDDLRDYIRPLYERGLDAVIVQDFGVIHLLRREFPDLELHASTQMTITGPDGARMLGELGISRVVLSRELSIAEMAQIHKETGMELEVFVHGALCYSYSGQCLFSSMLGGRSGNRGRCAQPCRLPYEVCEYQCEHRKRTADSNGAYVLSLKDFCGLENLAALKEAGVYSLKIEGRMKQEAYAAGVTAYYRRYIDILNMQDYKSEPAGAGGALLNRAAVSDSDRRRLLALGNRSGFTDRYYYKRNGNDMVTFEKPAYTTDKLDMPDNCREAGTNNIRAADVSGSSGTSHDVDKIPIQGWAYFHKGEESFITAAADIRSGKINSSYAMQAGRGSDRIAGVSVTVQGQEPQIAAKAPVSEEQIRQRLLKTGDTPFVFDELAIDADRDIFIPNSQLNQMRREVLGQLHEKLLAPYRREFKSHGEKSHKNRAQAGNPRLIASVSSIEQLETVLRDGRVTDIYLETVCYPRAELIDTLRQAVELISEAGVRQNTKLQAPDPAAIRQCAADESGTYSAMRIYLALPPIFRAHTRSFYSGNAAKLRALPIEGFVIRNYEEFEWVGELFPENKRILDADMYTYNDEASDAFGKLGAYGNTVPLELNRSEIHARGNSHSEMVIYGHYPLMVSAQCVHANMAAHRNRNNIPGHGTGRQSTDSNVFCDRTSGITCIRDRKGIEFPVRNFCSECVNIIYNSIPTMLFSKINEIECAGIRGLRLNFTIEDAN
ncbi:MAG: U32 family peptidase, partial [Clostridiales bacterium]|nr:U32 family peptidase [Clostridiales bacterium]